MKIIRDWQEADFLLTCDTLSLDIETETTPPTSVWQNKKYGLSFVAPIMKVALYTPGFPGVVFSDFSPEVVDFLRQVLQRPHYTLIGHNIVFDFRSVGGHWQITLPAGVKVWDTQVIALRTMLAEPEKGEASLTALVQKYCWRDVFLPQDREFYAKMKAYRADFEQVQIDLLQTDSLFWEYADLTADGGRTDVTTAAACVIDRYVLMDTVLTYYLYEFERDFVQQISRETIALTGKNRVIGKWEALPELIAWEQRISWTSCLQAATGSPVDQDYLRQQRQLYASREASAVAAMNQVEDTVDTSLAYLVLLEKILTTVTQQATYSATRRLLQQAVGVLTTAEKQALLHWLDWSAVPDSSRAEWEAFLLAFDPTQRYTRVSLVKAAPRSIPPVLDVTQITRRLAEHLYATHDRLNQTYRATLTWNWLRYRYDQDALPPPLELMGKKVFKYYYIFCLCNVLLPTAEDIQYNPFLVTQTFQRQMQNRIVAAPEVLYGDDYEDDDSIILLADNEVNYQTLAVETGTLSLGKKALDFYLPRPKIEVDGEVIANPDYAQHPARHLREAQENEALVIRIDELLAHAERDGRIHSVISRLTRTGRYTSTTPNLQNLNLSVAAGWLHAPEGYWYVELDYSNAENKTGAMVAADDRFAMATEGGDFHAAQAEIYFADEWHKAQREGDKKRLKQLRTMGKGVTFGSAYGAGAGKISIMIRQSIDEARRILANKDAAYPRVTQRKREAADVAQRRLQEGQYPTYTTLWTGARVVVPSFWEEGKRQAVGYKAWNYIQQGGVAEMIARATVEITEWLLAAGKATYVAFNVHDSLIVAVKLEEYADVLPEIIRIMCRQMPERFCRRTVPMIHFVSEVGPENARKWGYRPGREYPFSLDHFVNQWGVHLLPESQLAEPPERREAPTWIGPVHTGWTLAAEMQQQRQEKENRHG